ncbi:MAG: hypothetical protein OCC45_11090 [Desulfotalea sp.]
MKKLFVLLLFVLFISSGNLYAEDTTTVAAENTNISDNLNLEAVASVFGESKDLEEFEKKLNDPNTQISNLDLNEDGEVDYLKVTETSNGDTHVVTLQAVIGKDQYQNVATIKVEKKGPDNTQVQVVGDVNMYGPDYVIHPVYVHPPVIYLWFWGPVYRPWRSPFYWGHYPPYYRPWRPYSRNRYQTNINVHINKNNSYRRTNIRKNDTSIDLKNKSIRNDFADKKPDKSLNNRKKEIRNKQEVKQKVDKPQIKTPKINDSKLSTGKKVQKDWKPESKQVKAPSKARNNTEARSNNRTVSKTQKSSSKSRVKSNSSNTRQQIGRPSKNRSAGKARKSRRR